METLNVGKNGPANSAPLLIGLSGSLSGARTAHAAMFHAASRYLTAQNLPWLLADDQADPAVALAVAQRFVAQQVTAVIGHFNSACAEAVMPLYQAQQIVLLLPAASKNGLATGDGVFRLCATDRAQAALICQRAQQIVPDASKIELVLDGTPYSQRVLQSIQELPFGRAMSVVGCTTSPASEVELRIVLAITPNAFVAHRHLVAQQWQGQVLYSDDAYADDFLDYLRSSHLRSDVIGPSAGFDRLLQQACDLIVEWRETGTSSLSRWLAHSGVFAADGNALAAAWLVEHINSVPTRPACN